MSDQLVILPDWLACVSAWAREQPELTDLVGQRVFTEMPKAPELKQYPLMLLSQLTDPPITDPVHWAVRGLFQVDVWGGRKAETWTIAETFRALVTQRLTGVHHLEQGSIVVGIVRAGGIRRTPDRQVTTGLDEAGAETSSARPRCGFDFTAVMHPGTTGS